MDKYNNYMNSDRVDEIFLDFEECKSYVDRLNIRTVDEYDNIDEYMQYNDRIEGIEAMINAETKSLRRRNGTCVEECLSDYPYYK